MRSLTNIEKFRVEKITAQAQIYLSDTKTINRYTAMNELKRLMSVNCFRCSLNKYFTPSGYCGTKLSNNPCLLYDIYVDNER